MPPHLPPSNMELKMRTMATDMESIGRGGGLLGLSGKISLSMPQESSAPGANVPLAPDIAPKKKIGTYILFGVFGVAALFAVGYFLPLLIASRKGVPTAPPNPASVPATTTPAAPAPVEAHVSFFNTPADASLSVTLGGAGQPIEEWVAALKTANANFTEVTLTSKQGGAYGWMDFLSALGVPTTNSQFFTDNFQPDFTAFVYKDSAGFWPGYVLKLKPGGSPLLLAPQAQKLETDLGLVYSFFVQSPGPVGPSFTDAQISANQPVREISFAQKPAVFIYGWVRGQYLIIGTSEDAVRTAVSHL